MATIVNARDVLLQATSPRVATVTMSPNLVVSQDQVEGLGLVVQGIRSISLLASAQAFIVPTSGPVTPSSITITATLKSITATPTVTVTSGTISPVPTLVGGVMTIANTAMTTDTATVKVSVTQDGVTYTDEISLIKAKESQPTTVRGYVTNESHIVACDNLGNVVNYSGASGSFKVYQGSSDITNTCTFALAPSGNPNGLTYTLNAVTGTYSISGGFSAASTTATLTLRASFGATNVDIPVKLFKTLSGLAGVRGSRMFYITLSGATNTFSDTLATTSASVEGGPVLNDTVTQSNSSQGFSQTKFWTGSAWSVLNAVVDGNLLVTGTVGANAFVSNLLNSDNVLTRNLTVRDNAGVVILSATVKLGGTYIANAAIGNAHISGTIQSDDFVTGSAGWQLSKTGTAGSGTAEFNNVKVRGKVMGGSFTSISWPAAGAGNTGFYLGPEGLKLGNANNGSYFTVDVNGNLAMPGFSVTAGSATYSGALSAATGTFAGSLSAASGTFAGTLTASNIIATSHIQGAGVTDVTTYVIVTTGSQTEDTHSFSYPYDVFVILSIEDSASSCVASIFQGGSRTAYSIWSSGLLMATVNSSKPTYAAYLPAGSTYYVYSYGSTYNWRVTYSVVKR